MISAEERYPKRFAEVRGLRMAYVDEGAGDPILLLHGNPSSSYQWRNVIPHLTDLGRCVAPDLIGMGDSAKLPDSGPGSYTLAEHAAYLDALLEQLDVRERVTLVLHDWGSALGFDWAYRHQASVRGIAYMEAFVATIPSGTTGRPRRSPSSGPSGRSRATRWCWATTSSSTRCCPPRSCAP